MNGLIGEKMVKKVKSESYGDKIFGRLAGKSNSFCTIFYLEEKVKIGEAGFEEKEFSERLRKM